MLACCDNGRHQVASGCDCEWCGHHVSPTPGLEGCLHDRPTCDEAADQAGEAGLPERDEVVRVIRLLVPGDGTTDSRAVWAALGREYDFDEVHEVIQPLFAQGVITGYREGQMDEWTMLRVL